MKKVFLVISLMTTMLQSVSSTAQEAYLGEIRIFAGNSAPDGWALCEGQELNVSQYSALYALIGNNYGGNANLTFNLPDLRGRVPVNSGAGPGLSNITLGSKFGSNTTTLVTSNLPAHSHSVSGTTTDATTNHPTDAILADTSTLDKEYAASTTANVFMAPTGITGSGEPFSNMQPSLGVTYIICIKAGLGTAASGANADITSLTGLTTALSVAQGGTGQTTFTDGQLLIGNTTENSLSKATLTAGTGIIVSNAAGAITISATDEVFIPSNFKSVQNTQLFYYTSTFTVPSGVYKITIEAVGGSGGGGGGGGKSSTSTYSGGGGGGGGGAEYTGIILDVTPGTTISYTIGAEGTGGAAGTSTAYGGSGGKGGNTTVSYKSLTILTAHGGEGGSGGRYNLGIGIGGNGGSGSTAIQKIYGYTGANGDMGTGTTIIPGGKNGGEVTNILKEFYGGNGGLGRTSGSGSGYAGSAGIPGMVAISYYIK